MIFEWIFTIPHVLHLLGVQHAVISPGSRSAPLSIAFARQPDIKKYIIPDERSAAYIALGIAISIHKPVAIICTSGSAVANLYPGIIEAYYQKVPLLVFTADRPPEWIDQGDGQTIRQQDIFKNHIKKSYSFPVPDKLITDIQPLNEMLFEAVSESLQLPPGPVHLNMPFREPLYPIKNNYAVYNAEIDTIPIEEPKTIISQELVSRLSRFTKILIIAGQGHKKDNLNTSILKISSRLKIPIVAEVISNLQPNNKTIVTHDLFLSGIEINRQELQPDLIITYGNALLSKNLKAFLRNGKATHWHIAEDGQAQNVFLRNCENIPIMPDEFVNSWLNNQKNAQDEQKRFYSDWMNIESSTRSIIQSSFPSKQFWEMEAVKIAFDYIPEDSIIHLSNSMPIRWANYLQCLTGQNDYYSNRGTSGIDGCVSTAVGIALSTTKLNFLITGDMAFIYDRNGLWHNNIPSNLRILVLNNHGGGIFQLIDGPSDQPEYKEYFETHQSLSAENTAKDFNLTYFSCRDSRSLKNYFSRFIIDDGKTKILEVETDSVVNKRIFNVLKSKINKIWN